MTGQNHDRSARFFGIVTRPAANASHNRTNLAPVIPAHVNQLIVCEQ